MVIVSNFEIRNGHDNDVNVLWVSGMCHILIGGRTDTQQILVKRNGIGEPKKTVTLLTYWRCVSLASTHAK